MQGLLGLFDKQFEDMSLDEARAAYDHSIRNMGYDEIQALEQYPYAREKDDPKISTCKRIYRRIRALE